MLQQCRHQTAERGGGGFVAGEQQQQQLLHHVGVVEGEARLIEAAAEQVQPTGQRFAGRRALTAAAQHLPEARQQPATGLQGPGEGGAGQGQGHGEQGAGPDLEVVEEGLAVIALQAQHHRGDHAEGKAAQAIHQGHRRGCGGQLGGELVDQGHDAGAVAAQGRRREQLAHHPPAGAVIGAVAVGQRAAAQQLAHADGPPALAAIRLGQQIPDRPAAADEHQRLPEQVGGKHVAVLGEALLGKARITEEGQGLQHAGHGAGARQGAGGCLLGRGVHQGSSSPLACQKRPLVSSDRASSWARRPVAACSGGMPEKPTMRVATMPGCRIATAMPRGFRSTARERPAMFRAVLLRR